MYSSRIAGLGHYVPENIVTNDDLSKLMDTSDEWITERTGIKERRLIQKDSGEGTATMGVKAAEMALKRAEISKNDIDLVVFATLSPDLYFPGSGVLLQDIMSMGTCPALDIRNQCSGFIYGLSVADQFIKTGMYKNVLLVGSEYHSGGMDFTTRGRTVSVIFGDGAGAAVLTREADVTKGIQSTHLYSEGKYAEELAIIGPSTKRAQQLKTGYNAWHIKSYLAMVDALKVQLKNPKNVLQSVQVLQDDNAKLRKEIEQLNKHLVKQLIAKLETRISVDNDISCLFEEVDLDAMAMKDALFQLGQNRDNLVAVLASRKNNKPTLACYVSKTLAQKGNITANMIIKEIGIHIQGGGGGQPFFATAGGKNPDGIANALAAAKESVLK